MVVTNSTKAMAAESLFLDPLRPAIDMQSMLRKRSRCAIIPRTLGFDFVTILSTFSTARADTLRPCCA